MGASRGQMKGGDEWELNDAAQAASTQSSAMIPTVVPVARAQPMECDGTPFARSRPASWTTGLCSCCDDCCSCCAVSWCLFSCCGMFVPLGQLWERLKGPKGACLWIVAGLLSLALVKRVVTRMNANKFLDGMKDDIDERRFEFDLMSSVEVWGTLYYKYLTDGVSQSSPVVFILDVTVFVAAVFILAKVRAAVRSRDNIPEVHCSGCEDCCCAFWCFVSETATRTFSPPSPQNSITCGGRPRSPVSQAVNLTGCIVPCLQGCTTCQLMRHEGLTGGNYVLCSATGQVAPADQMAV